MVGANKPRRREAGGALICLIALLVVLALLSWSVGSYSISLANCWKALTVPSASGTAGVVLFQVRLPRILACILIGAGLALAGAAYQGLFNNPMVSPDILGASAGAGFGAAIGILCGWQVFEIQAASFAMGLLAVLLACTLAAGPARRGDPVLMLVLVGILVGSVFTALISITKYVADPYNKLPVITFWLLGSLAAISPKDVEFASVPIFLGSLPLFLLRWRLRRWV
jgi:iron complex transport system permease protein